MNATSTIDVSDKQASDPPDTGRTPAGEPVALHRRRGALALVGLGAGATAVAFLWRAAGNPGWLAYAFAAALVPIAVAHLAAWWDARVPLLVADETGIRLRDGRTWTGLRWDEVAALNITPARRPRRDARLTVGIVDGPHRPVPLALVDPADVRALPEALRELAPAKVPLVVAEPSRQEPDQTDASTGEGEPVSSRFRVPRRTLLPPADIRAARADVVVETPVDAVSSVAEGDPAPVPTSSPAPIAYTREESRPTDSVIGQRLARARHRLRLSVDDLADRTRVRPHVIEAMEVDDFSACGGDVYARGHLRTVARILGIDDAELVATFDERYATGPVPARKVFEAELAGPGRSLRTTTGGPRWSLLIGVMLVLVLLWGLARLLVPGTDGDGPRNRSGSGATAPSASFDRPTGADAARFEQMGERSAPTRLRLAGTPAATEPATDTAEPDEASEAAATPVTVRDDDGSVLFQGRIAADEVRRVRVFGAATVVAADGGALTVDVDGRTVGPLGPAGEPVRRTLGG